MLNAIEGRCTFLTEVDEQLKAILDSVTAVIQQVQQQENKSKSEELSEGAGIDAALITQAVDQFKQSVFAVADLCHTQIELTPAPSRVNKAPYILGLAHENIKESVAIEMRYAEENL
eukprot:Blabericola_migrator_1__7108@NODE_35_length_17941_cov_94_946347_g31_i0_p18_GENE_NODE_35_length_17941_cov_94_946347_g31_i0NODE_35_length_17941_cov_94_946347_g31_i0_p18_ORF_typecomplete_len117_score32_48RNA12/PF10443_9/0_01GCIP/PF13324_6/0_027Peptidase_C23/PF05379_11/0_032Suv3_N/PF18114_1/0_097Pox_EPC_I2L1/PF12575_8/0_17_NODE_35_length_17941_cov_94_946347_g31_i01521615566